MRKIVGTAVAGMLSLFIGDDGCAQICPSAPFESILSTGGGTDAVIRDLNGDSLLDIAVVNRQLDSMTVRLAESTGVYAAPVTYGTGHSPGVLLWVLLTDCTDPCSADFDGSGDVGFADMLALIGAWGSCAPKACPQDLNGDRIVDFADLLVLIGAWGPCA